VRIRVSSRFLVDPLPVESNPLVDSVVGGELRYIEGSKRPSNNIEEESMLLALKILVAVSVLILIVGLIKPKWVLFFMKQPDRLTVTALAMVMFMGAWTGIAKLTLKPKSQLEEKPAVEDSNRLKLDR
jgi:hypothetical protein